MENNIYVLRTHFVNDKVLRLYSQYQEDFGKSNVFMLLDTTNIVEIPTSINNLITITKEQAEKIDPLINEHNLPGMYYRAESAYIHLYDELTRHHCNFDYLWLIEYDVYCKGSFAKALQPCHNIECDFLAKGRDDGIEVRKFWKCPSWCWWDDLFGELKKLPHHNRKGCFFAITRVSTRMLDTIKANLGRSTGFCEVYFPCLCVANGLSYKSIPFESIGDVRFRPELSQDDVEKYAEANKLYHPVKLQK